ncbi:hypothetical protein [Sodalis-like endosymbiont of Proechinophthirus fluctus]|nr:hypothetical protein [Sodalis-like endosymbiont of Proechinophthirus fluctus]
MANGTLGEKAASIALRVAYQLTVLAPFLQKLKVPSLSTQAQSGQLAILN